MSFWTNALESLLGYVVIKRRAIQIDGRMSLGKLKDLQAELLPNRLMHVISYLEGGEAVKSNHVPADACGVTVEMMDSCEKRRIDGLMKSVRFYRCVSVCDAAYYAVAMIKGRCPVGNPVSPTIWSSVESVELLSDRDAAIDHYTRMSVEHCAALPTKQSVVA